MYEAKNQEEEVHDATEVSKEAHKRLNSPLLNHKFVMLIDSHHQCNSSVIWSPCFLGVLQVLMNAFLPVPLKQLDQVVLEEHVVILNSYMVLEAIDKYIILFPFNKRQLDLI